MPLFSFKCLKCNKIVEKFLKNSEDEPIIKCDCGSNEFEKIFAFNTSNRVWKGAQDYLENVINPEIDRIQDKISKGNDNVFLDICGDE